MNTEFLKRIVVDEENLELLFYGVEGNFKTLKCKNIIDFKNKLNFIYNFKNNYKHDIFELVYM